MNTPLAELRSERIKQSSGVNAKRKHTYRKLFIIWIFLIGIGATFAYFYVDMLKQQLAQDIARQTSEQLKLVQEDYRQQVAQLTTSVQTEIAGLENKVATLSELLAFTRDSESSKTDNSNQLYTQLSELKKQLDELKASLEVLQ